MITVVEQRAITEQLLLGALRADDATVAAQEQTRRAGHLATTSRRLSATLDESATHEAVLRITLPGRKAWCMLEVIEPHGALRRFGSIHPDAAKRALAESLARTWRASEWTRQSVGQPGDFAVVTRNSGPALQRVVRDAATLQALDAIGFEWLLVVPLVIRSRFQGTIMFVSGDREPPFAPDEIALAVEISAVCSIALDNACLYAEALALRRAADASNNAKSAFLAKMSHELRTPLNAIGGFVELIELGLYGPVTEDQLKSLARIKTNQMHLLTVINEILDYARIDGGHADFRQEEISLHRTVADVSAMLVGVAAAKDLTIVAAEEGEVLALGDPDRVRQIVVNLLMNAIKYSAAGSGPITIAITIEGEMAVLRVGDHGPGIPAHMVGPIFEPFIQVNEGLADRRGGVGLGLAISRELATAMGGKLTVESTLGVGSTFTLALPLPTTR
ncbi:MAG: ATP-binding protein [Gemmatimonadaceae bacterium]